MDYLASQWFFFAQEYFEEGRFADTIAAHQCNSCFLVDMEVQISLQDFIFRVPEVNVFHLN